MCLTVVSDNDGRHQDKVQLGSSHNPESYWGNLMRCWWTWGGGWGSQSRSSSYSASVTDRKSQVDVMSPASLLSCLLPLHNWSQINLDFWAQSAERGRWGRKKIRERQGERWHRLSPNRELLRTRRKKKNKTGGIILPSSVCTELKRHRE